MAKRDSLRTAHTERLAHEWCADKMPTKRTKRAKAKERQLGKKLCYSEDDGK